MPAPNLTDSNMTKLTPPTLPLACLHSHSKPQTREMCSFIHGVTPRAPTRQKPLGSRLGSLDHDMVTAWYSITTLAILPRPSRHDQPNERHRRPCGRAAGWRPPPAHFTHHLPCKVQEHGDARLWGHHGAPQPERMPSQ